MRNKIISFILCMFFVCPIFADIGSFKENVEETEKKEKEDSSKKNSDSCGDAIKCGDKVGCFDFCSSDFFIGFIGLWIGHNISVNFGSYPYCDFGYIQLPDQATSSKFFRGCVSASGVYMNDIGFGYEASLKGYLLKMIGPDIEYWQLFDKGTDLEDDNGNPVISENTMKFGCVRVGGRMSLLQFNPFSLAAYVQWIKWYDALDRNGIVFGVDMEIFPVKPFVLKARAGWQIFDYIDFLEIDASIGAIFNRFEIYGGYRGWIDLAEGATFKYHGATAGLRVYF